MFGSVHRKLTMSNLNSLLVFVRMLCHWIIQYAVGVTEAEECVPVHSSLWGGRHQ